MVERRERTVRVDLTDTTRRIAGDRLKRFAAAWVRPSQLWSLEAQVPLDPEGFLSLMMSYAFSHERGYYNRYVFDGARGAFLASGSEDMANQIFAHTVEHMERDIRKMVEVDRRGAHPESV